MSVRERWIVYPLLLWAWAAAVKPHMLPTEFSGITCRQLIVTKGAEIENLNVDRNLTVRNHLQTHTETVDKLTVGKGRFRHSVTVGANDNRPRISMGTAMIKTVAGETSLNSGLLTVYGKDGAPIVVLGPNDPGGTNGRIAAKSTNGMELAAVSASPRGGAVTLRHAERELDMHVGSTGMYAVGKLPDGQKTEFKQLMPLAKFEKINKHPVKVIFPK